jgi:hypothetical protein
VSGCPADAELCDATILTKGCRLCLQRTSVRASYGLPADIPYCEPDKEVLSTTGGVIAFSLLVLLGSAMGAVAFFYLTGAMPSRRRKMSERRRTVPRSGIALTSNEQKR